MSRWSGATLSERQQWLAADWAAFAFENSSQEPTTGCWLWLGSCTSNGYARTGRGIGEARDNSVARLVLGLRKGDSRGACHRCDTRPCVNPAHLFAASMEENMRDMVRKGRSQHGETHSSAKLTTEQVLWIRSVKGMSQTALAGMFGVDQSQISHIINRKNWRRL